MPAWSTCPVCAAIVADLDAHTAWHATQPTTASEGTV